MDDQIVVDEYDIEEANGVAGMPWISYKDGNENREEPIIISFKDIVTLFKNEGKEPDGGEDGRYHFTKTRLVLGSYYCVETSEEATITLRHAHIEA